MGPNDVAGQIEFECGPFWKSPHRCQRCLAGAVGEKIDCKVDAAPGLYVREQSWLEDGILNNPKPTRLQSYCRGSPRLQLRYNGLVNAPLEPNIALAVLPPLAWRPSAQDAGHDHTSR